MLKTQLKDVSETLLIPLWAKATETSCPNGIIKDPKSLELMKSIDYDFSKLKNAKYSQLGISIRTKLLDEYINNFIKSSSNPIIINIGSGLDTRYLRIKNKPSTWYELDLPEVIELKKTVFSPHEFDVLIGKSIFDFSWLNDISFENHEILCVAEGLFMYFSESEIKDIIENMKKKFNKFEMIIESVSNFMVKNSHSHDGLKEFNASFKWGISHPKSIEKITPIIHFKKADNYFDYYPEKWGSLGIFSKLPFLRQIFSPHLIHIEVF